jgi:antitoxin HigA-1
MDDVRTIPAFPVPHPGEMLREEILPAAGLHPAEAARRLGISRQLLDSVLKERSGVSAEMAWRLSAMFGNSPLHWLNMQSLYDLQRMQARVDIRHIERVAA